MRALELRQEPLVHFAVLAALLFFADAFWADSGREVIRVDRAAQDLMIQQRSELLLRPLTPQEQQEVIAGYIEDEILVREAYRRGLDKGPRIRRQLLGGVRQLLSADLPEPTEEELRAFYEQNPSRFATAPARTLDHVFYVDPRRVPEGLLEQLRDDAAPETLGDFDPNLGRIVQVTDREVAAIFGPDAAPKILAIEDDAWRGPIISPRGAHFVRVTELFPARMPTYEQVEGYLEAEWLMARQREVIEREVERLSEDYEVVIEPRETPDDA